MFPEHGIFGEEGTRERMEGEFRWYVDPLDGTTNFAHGFPQFCVSLGLEHRPAGIAPDEDGTLVAGVIYDPMRDELFTAERGRGAWLNGKPMHVSRIAGAGRGAGGHGVSEPQAAREPEHPLLPGVHAALAWGAAGGIGGAGSGLRCGGRLEAFWEFNLNPWDTAAGILLVEEAGGRVTDFSGGQFNLDSREILASNGLIHDELVGLFEEMFAGRESDAHSHAPGVCANGAESGAELKDERSG